MESKQELLLSRVIVNHLFLSQFEPFRACLRTLFDINPAVALAILKGVIRKAGQIEGVLWSKSVPSSSHLSWLCFGELSDLQADRGFSSCTERALWVSDPRLIFDNVEFLLYLELLGRLSATGGSTLTQESGNKLWDLGKIAFRSFGHNVQPEKSGTSSSSSSGRTRKAKVASLGFGETLSRTFEGAAFGGKTPQNFDGIAGTAGGRGFGDGTVEVAATREAGETSKERARPESTSLSTEEQSSESSENTRREHEELKKAGAEFLQELSATASHRFNERLNVLDVVSDLPGSDPDVVKAEGSQGEGVHPTAADDRIGDSAASHGDQAKVTDDDVRSRAESRAPSNSLEENSEPGTSLAEKHSTWVRKLTLYHPDLLNALSSNIRRQRYLKRPLPRLDRSGSNEESRRKFYFETEPGDEGMDSSDRERDNETSYEYVEAEKFEIGDGLIREVQKAHLEQMKEDIRGGRLAKAIQHLRYLRNGCGIPDSHYREVLRLTIDSIKKNVDARRSSRNRLDDSSLFAVYEQVIASGSPLLSSLTESTLDDLISEAAQDMRASGEQSIPPPLEKLHKRMGMRRALASTSIVSADSSWIRTCKIEMFHYARVMGAHVLETVMEAAFSSIRVLQFQKAADVLAAFPRLQPLVTVMGWDLLAGKTSARRQLVELLWASKQKPGWMEGVSSQERPTEEVSCIEDICNQLCYRLELAYFAATVNSGGSWQAGSKIFGISKGKLTTRYLEDKPPADAFVANLVLERLAMHSPIRVIFDVVPHIKPQDALQLIEMQPVGSSMAAFMKRQQDIELLHMHFGLQAAVRSLGFMESSGFEDQREQVQRRAKYFLLELQRHLDAVTTAMRKIWLMSVIVSLLHMDEMSAANEGLGPLEDLELSGSSSNVSFEGDKLTAVAFVGDVLLMFRHSLSSVGVDIPDKGKLKQGATPGGARGVGFTIVGAPEFVSKVWEQKAISVQNFVDDWEWRLAVLQRLSSSSQRQWQWKEAMAVLRAAPSTLLNMCVQRAQYDLGEEAVHRFDLPPEEAASLQLAEWVDGAIARSSVDDSFSRITEGASTSDVGLNFVTLRPPLPPLVSVLLCLDVAAASAKSGTTARHLLDQARVLLSQISHEGSKRQPTTIVGQKQDAALLLVVKRVLHRFQDLLDQKITSALSRVQHGKLLSHRNVMHLLPGVLQSSGASSIYIILGSTAALLVLCESHGSQGLHTLQMDRSEFRKDKSRTLQTTFSGADIVSSGIDVVRQGPKQRALGILGQIIEDAHNGKRQFLSGKLHNLVKALSNEDDDSSSKQISSHSDRKQVAFEHGLVLGLGFQAAHQDGPSPRSGSGDHGENFPTVVKSAGKRFFGLLGNKPTAYLSAFILYIATVGDIVDGVDTTHDFNFFSLIYERPNDLLTRLVFERGNADAAGKVAEIMGEDLVHQIITACVPPVYPPKGGNGWACIPRLPSREVQSTGVGKSSPVPAGGRRDDKAELYVLRRDVIKHLATLSPVRTILACVFGSSRFTVHGVEGEADSAVSSWHSQQQSDDDQWFYEFALEQSERYPTLHRWIQIQTNLQRLSESPISTKRVNGIGLKTQERRSIKRLREPEGEEDSDDEQEKHGIPGIPASAVWDSTQRSTYGLDSPNSKTQHASVPYSVLLDWENEGPYEEAVQGLMEEGKLVDALALADRYLCDGAPDRLLQLLIEKGEEAGSLSTMQWHGHVGPHHNLSNSSWQYCIRLRNKVLAATLALKYFHRWELDAAIDVLTMCSCHLEPTGPLYEEVIRVKQSLHQYGQILRADSRFSNWLEVEALCKSDPESLALRLASKGAVSTALSVAESFKLPNVTRRELQGRELVQLLTSNPTTGGGPAQGLRFLMSLQNPEDALPVAMAAMEQLPNLRSKQLLVHFLLKQRVGTVSEEEHVRLDRLALGLRMLGALPLPWQQRCSALHEHPHLILETLLMWKQLKAAAQLLQAFPSLRDDDLIISYAAKAITFSSSPAVERRTYTPSAPSKPAPRTKSNFTSGITSFQREARRAFSWTSRETSSKIVPKEVPSPKQKGSMLPPSQIAAWEAMAGIPEDRSASDAPAPEGHERPAPVTIVDEWVLTGDSTKDDAVRRLHRYESAPSAILFKALLALCSVEFVGAKAAVELCIIQIQKMLCADQLPLDASSEIIERAYHSTEAFVQALLHARAQLRSLVGQAQASSSSSTPPKDNIEKKETVEEDSTERNTMFLESPRTEKLPELLMTADVWLSRVELLQSLLGTGVTASLDDLVDEGSAIKLRDRLIVDERYSMAVYTCTKCKIDALPVWEACGHALLRIEHYAQARVKFKQALRYVKGDPAPFVHQIISSMESGPPADVTAVENLYIHMAKSSSSSDDSLSADSYLNVLYMPSFTKSDRSRRSSEDSADSLALNCAHMSGEESTRSNLDGVRYEECVHYLQEYARQDLLSFQFRHGRFHDACLLFFPPDSVPPQPLPSPYQAPAVSSSPQRPDTLATDYGSIDDLCEYCVSYAAVPVLERVLSARLNNQDSVVAQHTAAALTRICNYCEGHRHFNHLYRFQVLKKDYVAAGLCCIQLFLNSSQQEEALRHLERARTHFDEGLFARQQAGDLTKSVAKALRGKLPSDKLTEEELSKFTARINIQMEVVRMFSEVEGPLWKRSLFGNPNDADTFKRRCDVAETLVERNFDLAFQIIFGFGLPAVHIYAGVAASLAERRKNTQLAELLRNIKGTIEDDDRDQVLGAAINVYANKHRERPDRLIDILSSSHRKVLACVVCGRLKTAFQIAAKSGSVADVQYVNHQARQSGTKAVQDLCRQWLAKNS